MNDLFKKRNKKLWQYIRFSFRPEGQALDSTTSHELGPILRSIGLSDNLLNTQRALHKMNIKLHTSENNFSVPNTY